MRSKTGRLGSLIKTARARASKKHAPRDRSIATYMLVAACLAALTGVAGLGSDGSHGYKVTHEIQTAARLALPENSQIKLGDRTHIQARAVSGTISSAETCVLALDETKAGALSFYRNTVMNASCGIVSNSSQPNAINVHGSASVKVQSVQAYGGIKDTKNRLTAAGPFRTLPTRFEDPYAGIGIPKVDKSYCIRDDGDYRDEVLVPGVYCGAFHLYGNITLVAGVYIIYGTNSGKRHMRIKEGANVSATGPVTIIFTGTAPRTVGGVKLIDRNAVVNLSAPGPSGHADGVYAGKYPGMLMIQDSMARSLYHHHFDGSASMRLSGVIYFPFAKISFKGGADSAAGCLQIIGRTISFSGNTNFGNTPEACAAQGVARFTQTPARLTQSRF